MDQKSPKERMIMALEDEVLNRVTGGSGEDSAPVCPLCNCEAVNNVCENLRCSNYGSYILDFFPGSHVP